MSHLSRNKTSISLYGIPWTMPSVCHPLELYACIYTIYWLHILSHTLLHTYIYKYAHIHYFFFILYINIHINTKKQHHYSSLFGSGAVEQVRKEEWRLIWNRCWKQRWALICGVTEREEKLHDFRKRKKQGHDRKICKNKILYMIMNVTMSNISFSVSLKWMWNIF